MERRLNPNVPTFNPKPNKVEVKPNPVAVLQSAMAGLDEDILSLKLTKFEMQLEINRKDEEIQRLSAVIAKLLTKSFNQIKLE